MGARKNNFNLEGDTEDRYFRNTLESNEIVKLHQETHNVFHLVKNLICRAQNIEKFSQKMEVKKIQGIK